MAQPFRATAMEHSFYANRAFLPAGCAKRGVAYAFCLFHFVWWQGLSGDGDAKELLVRPFHSLALLGFVPWTYVDSKRTPFANPCPLKD